MNDLSVDEMNSILNELPYNNDDLNMLNDMNFYELFNEYTIYENDLLELESKNLKLEKILKGV